MNFDLLNFLSNNLKLFDYSLDENVLKEYSQDESIFKIKPKVVVFPRNSEEIKNLVKIAKENNFGITPRAAGTDMSGGSIGEDILIVFTKYLNKFNIDPEKKIAIAEPGVYFRDFEKELNKYNLMLPSYPASKEICALGGMVANNSGGEKTLKYGKTEDYVLGLKVVLSDGEEYYFEKLDENELRKKLSLENFEGEVYRKTYELIKNNYELIQKSKPKVSKNSSGYNIWKVYENGYFDLTKLFVGSQGTLGIITEIKFKLLEKERFSQLLVIFIKDLKDLPHFTNEILKLEPTSLEITDDHTFKIFLKFFKEMAKLLGTKGIFSTFKLFLPEILMIAKIGFPKLIVLAEFTSQNKDEIKEKTQKAKEIIKKYKYLFREPKNEKETEKYWKLRRDTYKLLREKIKNLTASPFIDDFIILPEYLPEFLPKLYQILDEYKLIYTISGHLGDGNLHIIPLIDLKNKNQRKNILEITDKIYDLVLNYNGILTAEHNDGIIRGPYLEKEFGKEIYNIFLEIKKIFDPYNIFNPNKKVMVKREYLEKLLNENFDL
jgi:FAD/FMN-containing dehydrogenase